MSDPTRASETGRASHAADPAPPGRRAAAWPEDLRRAEADMVVERRKAVERERGEAGLPPEELGGTVGVGLSGGGIRSATFCLGFFQGLAAKGGLLGRIDYLSTVSGGGYFGSFLGRLFSRDYVAGPRDAERVLTEREAAALPDSRGVVRNLRENGRYLSPNGSGDLLLGGAVLLRNWVSVHVVLALFVLAAFLLLQLLRLGLERWQGSAFADGAWVGGILWRSPWLALPLVLLGVAAVPLGWAYWLVGRPQERRASAGWRAPSPRDLRFLPLILVAGAGALWVVWLDPRTEGFSRSPIGYAPIGLALVTWAWWVAAEVRTWVVERRERRVEARREGVEPDGAREAKLYRDARVRHLLSVLLKRVLVLTVALAAIALVDSLGQTLHAVAASEVSVAGWIASSAAALAGAAGLARRLVVLLARKGSDGRRVGLPTELLATLGGIGVTLFLLVLFDAASHAIAWVEQPGGALRRVQAELLGLEPPPPAPFAARSVGLLLASAGAALALSLALGRIWSFLNRSSHQPLYCARLTRAYLGASNPRRLGADPVAVTQPIREDDVDLRTYWKSVGKGAPLHLVNVTVNETCDGRSQIEQRDRKGTGLAVGPGGLSLGVGHHVVHPRPNASQEGPALEERGAEGGFRVFAYPKGKARWEPLSFGTWVGISGAAFSTGLGARTSLGLSMLLGLANVRLGYWWSSGIDPRLRGERFRHAPNPLRWLFPVQSYLCDELLARFPGTARRHWYLSDGGHFENMGGYELLRRRLPLIVIVDAEADPDYTFGGLANLVRKARLDFGAEISFLTPEEIDRELPPEVACHVGSLEQLRRGRWKASEERSLRDAADGSPTAPDGGGGAPHPARRRPKAAFESADRTGRSLVHAALARVRYEDGGAESRLLYVKPSLLGDEPEDVLDYHRRHPAFPQEPTADQFFDEAQWESYRRLGEHVAQKLFRSAVEAERDEAWIRRAPPERRAWNPGRLTTPPRSRDERTS